jgi:hypothetical protein
MCRNIHTLYNFDPPATQEEIRAAALQYVRKISGYRQPSKANQAAFLAAVEGGGGGARGLVPALTTEAPPRDRLAEAAKAHARAARRFSNG